MVASHARINSRFVYADLASFPNDNKRREILDGALIVNPAPYVQDQRILRTLERFVLDGKAFVLEEKLRNQTFTTPLIPSLRVSLSLVWPD